MIQARLVVVQVLDLWHVSGALLTDEPDGVWSPVATFSDDLSLSVEEGDSDPVYTLLRAIRLWSEMTISR